MGSEWNLAFSVIAAVGTPLTIWTIWLARRADKRSTELLDVTWYRTSVDRDIEFAHSGSTVVKDVTIVLTVDGVTSSQKFIKVARDSKVSIANIKNEELFLKAKEAEERYERELAEYEAKTTRNAGISFNPYRPPLPIDLFGPGEDITAVFTWRYPSGQPGRQELNWTHQY